MPNSHEIILTLFFHKKEFLIGHPVNLKVIRPKKIYVCFRFVVILTSG